MKKRIRTNGIIITIAVILVAVFPDKFLRIEFSGLNYGLGVIGLALMLFGLLLRVSSRGYKSENSQSGFSLVKGGPYALVRNPMYLGIFTIGAGTIIFLFQWWVLALFITFLLIRYLTLIVKEEALLTKAFGQQYSQYLQEIPRLFPRVRDLFKADIRKCLPLRLTWIKREASSVVVVPLLSLIISGIISVRAGKADTLLPQFTGYFSIIIIFAILIIYLSRSYESPAKKS